MDNRQDLRTFYQFFYDLEKLRKNWFWFLLLGIGLIALGVIAISSATYTTLASMIFLGILLLAGGVAQVIYSFAATRWSGFFISLLIGILYAIVGFLLMAHPAASALSLTMLLAAFYMVSGLFLIIGSFMMKFEHWGWALFSGVVKFILGLLIWQGWPATGLWVFGLFIGIDLIFYGWFWVMLSLTARNVDTKHLQ